MPTMINILSKSPADIATLNTVEFCQFNDDMFHLQKREFDGFQERVSVYAQIIFIHIRTFVRYLKSFSIKNPLYDKVKTGSHSDYDNFISITKHKEPNIEYEEPYIIFPIKNDNQAEKLLISRTGKINDNIDHIRFSNLEDTSSPFFHGRDVIAAIEISQLLTKTTA